LKAGVVTWSKLTIFWYWDFKCKNLKTQIIP
jgi:hypothetical protein